jgi:hypothetical protein
MNGGRTFSEMLAEIDALTAENERLRAALRKIAKPAPGGKTQQGIAKRALKEGDGD